MGSYRRNVNSNIHHYRDQGGNHKFSKQQFLQANCQFVVLDGHDYSVHKADPDWPVEWDCIEEVRFKQSACTDTTCPICLEFPVAAKITRCGHIYCWTCMLQYLSLVDENCRQCPICFEPVYRSDLRSVVSHLFVNYSVGDEVVLRLMFRTKGCVEVEPYRYQQGEEDLKRDDSSCGLPSTSKEASTDNDHYWSHANLIIADSQTIISKVVQRERKELLLKLELDKDEPGICFIEQALGSLDRRFERLNLRPVSLNSSKVNSSQNQLAETRYLNDAVQISAKVSSSPQQSDQVQQLNSRSRVHHDDLPSEPTKSYLFYQCSDGQHIYLNPFSTRILCHQYESLHNCPTEIKAKILQMDWISMRETWRKRFKYLEHLPLSCEFRLIEIDLDKSNLISASTYRVYEEQIKKRERERQRRIKEEKKRDKIIQVEQNRRIYGIQPSLKINLDNPDQFPSVSDERYIGFSLSKSNTSFRNDPYNYLLSSDEDQEEEVSATVLSTEQNHDVISDNVDNSSQPLEGATEQEGVRLDSTSELRSEEGQKSPDIQGVVLSFRDIQLQEEAAIAKQKSGSNKNGKDGLPNGMKYQGDKFGLSQQQSSFAQLLVNAKTSQKQWTRSASSSNSSSSAGAAIKQSSIWPNRLSSSPASSMAAAAALTVSTGSDSEEGDDELCHRPKASGFTLSDFIDINNVSSSGKKRGNRLKSNHHSRRS